MIIDWSKTKLFIMPGKTDMRKQINGLSIIVQDELELDPFTESMFLFCSKNRKQLKLLYWDKNGFCMWQKKLERDKFPWAKNKDEVTEIDKRQFKMLLAGIDFFEAHQELKYEHV